MGSAVADTEAEYIVLTPEYDTIIRAYLSDFASQVKRLAAQGSYESASAEDRDTVEMLRDVLAPLNIAATCIGVFAVPDDASGPATVDSAALRTLTNRITALKAALTEAVEDTVAAMNAAQRRG